MLLHCSAVLILHRLDNWNTAVYRGTWRWRSSAHGSFTSGKVRRAAERAQCGPAGFAAGLALFCSPLLFYVGLLDAYLSHCLYSANVPSAVMLPRRSASTATKSTAATGVLVERERAQPPAHEFLKNIFAAQPPPGDRLEVVDSRPLGGLERLDRYRWQHTGVTFERIRLSSDDWGVKYRHSKQNCAAFLCRPVRKPLARRAELTMLFQYPPAAYSAPVHINGLHAIQPSMRQHTLLTAHRFDWSLFAPRFDSVGESLCVVARPSKRETAAARIESIMHMWDRALNRRLPRPRVIEGEVTQAA